MKKTIYEILKEQGQLVEKKVCAGAMTDKQYIRRERYVEGFNYVMGRIKNRS